MNLDENLENNQNEIEVKIRTIDNINKELVIKIKRESTIKILKEEISKVNIIIFINMIFFNKFQKYQIPIEKQRLIFRGHVLEDSKTLIDNKIENGDVIHLLVRIEQNNNNNNNESNNSNIPNPNPNPNRNISFVRTIIVASQRPLPFPFPFQEERNNNEESHSNNFYTDLAQKPFINLDEIRETIAQNLLEVQNMIDYGNYNEFINEIKSEKENDMNCFNLDKRILEKGQWVDVKDTVDKWLDAQVIEVSEDKKKVKIHYNKWGERWDEWIDTNSPRIMPFRYHTRQKILTNYNSPFPNKKPDKNITLLSFENINKKCSTNIIDSSSENINNNNNLIKEPDNHLLNNLGVNGFIGIFNEFDKINKVISGLFSSLLSEHNNYNINNIKEKQKNFYYHLKRLIPILDRTGRIYSDISTFLDHAIKENYMELISKNLFEDKNNIHEDLKYFSFEEKRKMSQELIKKYSEGEIRSRTLNFVEPVNKYDTKLINYIPIIDTPLTIRRKENNINSSRNNNDNNNFLRNIKTENINFEYKSINKQNNKGEEKEEIDLKDDNNNILNRKTKRENIDLKDNDDMKEDKANKKKK